MRRRDPTVAEGRYPVLAVLGTLDARRLVIPGAVLATVGPGGIVFGLIESQSAGFAEPLVLVSLLVGAGALAAFALVEARSDEPMLPLGLFRSRNFSGANLLTLL